MTPGRPAAARWRWGLAAAAILLPLPGLGPQQGAPAGEWRYYAGDAGSTRYSPIDLIGAQNVAELEVVWRWSARNFGPRPESYYRVTPLFVDGVLYATAGYRRSVVAIDGATGETLWMYRMDEGDRGGTAPRVNSGRGVAFWDDGPVKRVLLITPGYHLVSLDADTGRPDHGFGTRGIVDLKTGLGRPVDPVTDRIGSSSPPMIVGDVVVVGAAFPQGDRPPSRSMPPGSIRGYDVRTGELLWTFHTIPPPGELGNDTWEDGSWEFTGNASAWTPMTADPELGYVYLPVEAGTGDYYGGHRRGANLFSQSLVCLDARTGERVWHFQTVHHGIWDYDPPAPPILMDIEVNGREIKAVALVTKQAFTYVFDRITGDPVWPIEERAVPQSDVPGERTSPTQPFPTLPVPFDRQGVTEDDLIDLTPELRAAALEIVSRVRLGELFTPPSLIEEAGLRGTLVLPGSLGGANWPGAAFDPETHILYVPSATEPSLIGLAHDPETSDMDYIVPPQGLPGPGGLPLIKPPWGRITALDMSTGQRVWEIANDDTPAYVRDHLALESVDLPRTGRPTRAGLLVTRTLLFAGTGGGGAGSGDEGVLRAHDKASGEILAELTLPSHQTGVPMTYELDGRQYIVVAIAGRGVPGELVALAVPN